MRRVQISGAAGRRFVGVLAVEPKPRAGAHRWNVLGFPLILGVVLHAAPTSGSFLRPSVCQSAFALRGSPVNNTALTQAERTMRATTMTVMGIAASAVVHTTSGAELAVPSKQYPTIQAAIDGAVNGDVVVIAAGLYREKLLIQGKTISLLGTDASTTIIDGAQVAEGSPVLHYINSTQGGPCVIEGVTIQNGSTNGVILNGVWNLVMRDCVIRHCTSTYGAALIPGGGNARFERVTFRSNTAVNGGAVNTANGFVGSFDSCAFIDNIASNTGGALIDYYSSSTLTNCTFRGNSGAFVVFSYLGSSTTVGSGAFCANSGAALGACCGGVILDVGSNTESVNCPTACVGDLVVDGLIDALDMAVLLNFWNTDGSQYPGVDLNNDGIVDAGDIAVLLNAWGQCAQ